MIISYSKNFIYIHIDKAGGTSIEECLTPFLSFNDIILGGVTLGQDLENIYLKYYGDEIYKIGIHKHSTAKQIKNYVKNFWDVSYKFATVRDPIDIGISMYYYNKDILYQYIEKTKEKTIDSLLNDISLMKQMIVNGDQYIITLAKQIKNNQPVDDFIIELMDIRHSGMTQQIDRLSNDPSIHLFDISNIKDNWKDILKNINIDQDVELLTYNKSSNPGNIKLDYKTEQIIKNRFKDDYAIIPKITGIEWK